MNIIHIENSYKIWNTDKMWYSINDYCTEHGIYDADYYLNRGHTSMYVEWWIHNIGYYITKPLCCFKTVNKINLKLKDINLKEWKQRGNNI